MIDAVEKAFAMELLGVSSKASQLANFIWTVYNISGTVPISVLSAQFDKTEEFVDVLSRTGIIRYSLGGFINKEQKKESLSIYLSEDFSKILQPGIKRKEFENILFRNYGEKLIPYCRSGLTEPLTVMLTSLIFFATPDKPVFVNTVVRKAARVCMKSYVECRDIMDYYMHKFLGLVAYETGSMINLSVRSKQRVMAYPRIWEMYVKEPQGKIQDEEIKKPEERKVITPRSLEQQKRLRGYFPWLKF